MSKKLKTFRCYGVVKGSKYLGKFEVKTAEEAKELALEGASCDLCNQCSDDCEDAEIYSVIAEEVK